MSARSRILAFGSAGALVLAGGACAVLVGGVVGEVLTIVLISAGLAGALLLLFLEVGLSEERELARDEDRRRRRRAGGVPRRPWQRSPPRRPR